MSHEEKPREFWIIKNESHHSGLEWFDAFKTKQAWIHLEPKPQIHVIEYSAYQALLEIIRAQRDALKGLGL